MRVSPGYWIGDDMEVVARSTNGLKERFLEIGRAASEFGMNKGPNI